MITLYDYLPSQNGYKIRVLLAHLGVPYATKLVQIFAGEGQRDDYLAINPTGAVPAIRFDDGRVLSESNAILFHLARGSRYLPDDPFAQAKVLQWLSFEADYIQSTAGSLRHWLMTGKARPEALIEAKRHGAIKALQALDRELATREFIVDTYSIADISLYAYTHCAEEAGIDLAAFVHVSAWLARVRAQPGFLATTYPYAIDPDSGRELP
jgi:glutathione S-transferase